jgi:hypothetical protein
MHSTLSCFKKLSKSLQPIDLQPIKATLTFSAGEAQAFNTAGAIPNAAAATAVVLIKSLLFEFMNIIFRLIFISQQS